MQTIKAALVYFLLVFGAGFMFGVVRVLLVVPRVGERAAELLEMPLMFAAIVLSARWVVRRHAAVAGRGGWLVVGCLAAAGVLAADVGVGVFLRGLPVRAVLFERDPISGTAYYAMLVVFAVAPAVVAARQWRVVGARPSPGHRLPRRT